MTSPIEAVIMKHVGAPALAAVFASVALGGICLIGIVFLGYGIQTELSQWMSDGAAAIVVGVVLFAVALLHVRHKSFSTTDGAPEEPVQASPRLAGSLLTSNLSAFARTAVIGVSARRPIAMLAIAVLAGAALLVLSDGENDSRTAHGRKLP